MKQERPDLSSDVFEMRIKIKAFEVTLKVKKVWVISLSIFLIKMVIKLWLNHH